MTRIAALLLALFCLAMTPVPAGAGEPEGYLAYQIRLARNEPHYRLDAGLSRLAEKRAEESSRDFRHRRLVEVPCHWGEVLGWVSLTEQGPSVRWIMDAWRHSKGHWAVISSRWDHYGVGVRVKGGRSYMAVVFAGCRI